MKYIHINSQANNFIKFRIEIGRVKYMKICTQKHITHKFKSNSEMNVTAQMIKKTVRII